MHDFPVCFSRSLETFCDPRNHAGKFSHLVDKWINFLCVLKMLCFFALGSSLSPLCCHVLYMYSKRSFRIWWKEDQPLAQVMLRLGQTASCLHGQPRQRIKIGISCSTWDRRQCRHRGGLRSTKLCTAQCEISAQRGSERKRDKKGWMSSAPRDVWRPNVDSGDCNI